MFFWGVYLGNEDVVIVLIKKFQKNVKKHYLFQDIQTFQAQFQTLDLAGKISAFYNENQYMIKKRLYSQDNRPVKTVTANPGIVIGYHGDKGHHLVETLRDQNVRAEAVIIKGDGEPFEEEYNKGLGRNFYVHRKDLDNKLITVFKQNRLIATEDKCVAQDIIQGLTYFRERQAGKKSELNINDKVEDEVFLALSMPIWFRETIKYSRAYSA